jgi:hypothetical protein
MPIATASSGTQDRCIVNARSTPNGITSSDLRPTANPERQLRVAQVRYAT